MNEALRRKIAGWILLLLAAGCTLPPADKTPELAIDPRLPSPKVALRELDELRLVPRPKPDGSYRRAEFGPRWYDTDGNGCDTRDDILYRDVDKSVPFDAARQGSCDHDMLAGSWFDPYTGETISATDLKNQGQAQSIQIEHVVALAVAWRYGASEWDKAARTEFANDQLNLLAVSGEVNRAKSDLDAAGWCPKQPFQCAYALRYVAVKAKWKLAVDSSERSALAQMIDTCEV
ncbi:MAG: HNH endonuclease family protein [Propionibacteriaceae bacterium]|jgi:hypothetical protein|nr:HNH endonuclease family protein [Propionibacteriaceae bacterium]